MALTYSQALLDRATAYVAQPLNSRRYDTGLSEISQLYADITGQPVGKCRQCQYRDFLAVVTAYIREATRFLHPEAMPDSKYSFAPQFANETIADSRYTKSVTADNLTDQDAEALITLGYGHVIVAKPDQEALLSGASEQHDGGDADTQDEHKPSELETELKNQLDGQFAAHQKLLDQYSLTEENRQQATKALETDKQAHKATKAQLTKTQQQLTAANIKLSEKASQAGTTDLTGEPTPEPGKVIDPATGN